MKEARRSNHLFKNVLPYVCINGAEGVIQQIDIRILVHSTGQAHTLLLTTTQVDTLWRPKTPHSSVGESIGLEDVWHLSQSTRQTCITQYLLFKKPHLLSYLSLVATSQYFEIGCHGTCLQHLSIPGIYAFLAK